MEPGLLPAWLFGLLLWQQADLPAGSRPHGLCSTPILIHSCFGMLCPLKPNLAKIMLLKIVTDFLLLCHAEVVHFALLWLRSAARARELRWPGA